MQIKAYAIKNDTNKRICSKKIKIIMKIKNKILLLQNLIISVPLKSGPVKY